MKRAFATRIFPLLLSLALAQPIASLGQLPPQPAPQPAVTAEAKKQDGQELEILRAELRAVRSFQEQLLSTVHWTLGTVAGVALLMVGFGWFANFRIYERDKDAISRELRTLVEQRLLELKAQIDDHVSSSRREVSELYAEQQKALSETFEQRLVKQGDSFKQNIDALSSELNANLSALIRQVAHIEMEILEMQRDDWRAKGVYMNALRCSAKLLRRATSVDAEFMVSRSMDAISVDLDKVKKGGGPALYAELKATIASALDGVTGPLAGVASEIKNQLA